MRFNWRRFIFVSSLIWVVCICAGCTASWLSAIDVLLPALGTAIDAIAEFVAGLEGKTLSAAFVASVQKIITDVQTEIQNLQTIIASVSGTVTTSVVQQIQAVMQSIVANLGSILQGANITDSSTVTKLTQLIGIGVSAVQAILALIPLMLSRLSATPEPSLKELEETDKVASSSIKDTHDGLKKAYKLIIGTSTENADVNTALEACPKSLP